MNEYIYDCIMDLDLTDAEKIQLCKKYHVKGNRYQDEPEDEEDNT